MTPAKKYDGIRVDASGCTRGLPHFPRLGIFAQFRLEYAVDAGNRGTPQNAANE